jgi:hypothetical protein
VTALGAKAHHVGPVSQGEALQLISEWSGFSPERLLREAAEVIALCGNVPLALSLTGAMARGGARPWSSIADKLRSDAALSLPGYRYPNIEAAIDSSVSSLPESERSSYLDLAVVPDATPIPRLALGRLWGVDGEREREREREHATSCSAFRNCH